MGGEKWERVPEKRSPVPTAKGPGGSHAAASPTVRQLLALQRAAGNRATGAFLAAAQPELRVGADGDPYEREADAVADDIVAHLDAHTSGAADASTTGVHRGLLSRLQRRTAPGAGTGAGAAYVQRAAVDPGQFFGDRRDATDVDSDIATDDDGAGEMRGFGTKVGQAVWHTKLEFDPLHTPGNGEAGQMHAEGSGVRGVIGPDHPYGSQPESDSADANNQFASAWRGGMPHVAAHIVNDQLGGPGVAQNLFAFPATANTRMEQAVEKYMKKAVASGNYIWYEAAVTHPEAGPATSITMSWNLLDDAGNDKGGGQTGVVIAANSQVDNRTAVDEAGGTAAANRSLIHPRDPSAIKSHPWGPFQMPDPKNIEVVPWLDVSAWPAVGSTKAFEEFFAIFKKSPEILEMFLTGLDDATVLQNLSRWIESKESLITIRDKGRGITRSMVEDLRSTKSQDRLSAFVDLMGCSDATKVWGALAKLSAKSARLSAASRV